MLFPGLASHFDFAYSAHVSSDFSTSSAPQCHVHPANRRPPIVNRVDALGCLCQDVRQHNAARRNHCEESMRNRFSKTAAGCALAVVCLAHVESAQTPAPSAPAAPVSNVVANPTYISIPLEITVNRPAT